MSDAYRVALGVTELSKIFVEMATMSEGMVISPSPLIVSICNQNLILSLSLHPLKVELWNVHGHGVAL